MRNNFINIGGADYSRTAYLWGFKIEIVGYDINTERYLIVDTQFEKNKRIELDNANLKLREKYQRHYN